MKKTLIISTVIMALSLRAEPYPSQWVKFTLGDYVYDIESIELKEDNNKAQLLDICRTNVAKQIEVKLEEHASVEKQSVNGVVDSYYSRHTEYSTNLDLKFLSTETIEDTKKKRLYAIAYIAKNEASNYYVKQLQLVYEELKTSLIIIDYLIQNGELIKAGEELKTTQAKFTMSHDNYKWLLIFGCSEETINLFLSQRAELKQELEHISSYLSSNTKFVYITCNGTIFDIPCTTITNQIKSAISELSCSFTDNRSQADWIIEIYTKTTSRKKSNEQFVTINISGNVFCANKQTSYALYKSSEDCAPIDEKRAAEIILQRDLIGGIINDITDILKSK